MKIIAYICARMIKNDVYDTAKNDIYYGLSITIEPTLSIALVTRIFSLKVMMLDGFSGNIIFLITCILCAVLYLIFKTTIDSYILPFLCKCSKIQLAVAESATEEVTKPVTKQEANLPSYQEHYDAVAEKKRIEAEETLQRVLDYTMQTMVIYMSEAELDRLCSYITEYSLGDTPCKYRPYRLILP